MKRFQKKYIDTVAPKMRQAFGYTNTLAVPKIEKVVLNVGLSKGLNDKKYQDAV
ncbi:MAG: 50S ribosomal protein L5, partial [Patescibacteria group bacterium]